MTDFPESHKDLLDAPIACLTTLGSDGYPQSTLTWFVHDGGKFHISLATGRVKVKNMRTRPQVSLVMLDYSNTQRYLEIRGDATLTPDPDYSFADKQGAKYETDIRTFDPPGGADRVWVTIEPKNVYAVDLS